MGYRRRPKYLNMRPTPNLLAKGFFGRSVDEFKRLSGIALRAEATKHATKPYVLTSFHDASTLEDCKLMSDADMGGFSRAHLDFIPPVTSSSSIPLPSSENKSGYAAWRTKDRSFTIFGKSLWDIDPYAFLALRIKSDGRKYFVNIQTESIVPTDLHQHRLYARRPGE